MYRRNLSFNTDIYELACRGISISSSSFREVPTIGSRLYITFGIGTFYYNPYTYLNGQKVYLRPLGTEGQGDGRLPKGIRPFGRLFPDWSGCQV